MSYRAAQGFPQGEYAQQQQQQGQHGAYGGVNGGHGGHGGHEQQPGLFVTPQELQLPPLVGYAENGSGRFLPPMGWQQQQQQQQQQPQGRGTWTAPVMRQPQQQAPLQQARHYSQSPLPQQQQQQSQSPFPQLQSPYQQQHLHTHTHNHTHTHTHTHTPPRLPIQPPLEELRQTPCDYVNLQDIQKQPLLPPLPVMTKKRTLPEQTGEAPSMEGPSAKQPRLEVNPSPIPIPIQIPIPIPIKHECENETANESAKIPPHVPEARVKYSPHSSVTNSPALSTRSPAIPSKPRPVSTALMVAVAEECLDKARAASHDVAMTLGAQQVDDYHKLIATSLSCLEAALSFNLPPREEARVRLRYAAVLQEETENLMEAETALGKGITLCDKHRLYDLKYCTQYLMLKVLFRRNHKAALKAVDGHISNCEAFKHVQWFYAFRLLKASFYLDIGSTADAGVLENVRSIQAVASARGDSALAVLASLLEGFTLLKTAKEGSAERVQACIAQVAKHQLEPSVQQIMQLTVLTLLLEVTASLHNQSPDHTAHKLRMLQKTLDECNGWNNVKASFLVPVRKQASTAKTVSEDTKMVIQPGGGETDYVVMTFMTKMELKSLVFTISGLANFHKPSGRSAEFWTEGLRILDTWDQSTAGIPYGAEPLSVAMKQRAWRVEAQAYLSILLGLVAASHCRWADVRQVVQKLEVETLVSPSTQPTLRLLATYLKGVWHQGVGDLASAMHTFKDPCFALPRPGAGTISKAGRQEIALLAGLNRLWIMQHPSCQSDEETKSLIEELQPRCASHRNLDLRTAWHNVMAVLVTEPAQQLNQQKQHIHAAMAGSKATSNVLGAAVTLCIMRSRFFENVIGEQALKSARAAAKQAQRSGNVLWQSVADGMLAQSYEVQGQREEAKQEWDRATMEARDAFSRTRD